MDRPANPFSNVTAFPAPPMEYRWGLGAVTPDDGAYAMGSGRQLFERGSHVDIDMKGRAVFHPYLLAAPKQVDFVLVSGISSRRRKKCAAAPGIGNGQNACAAGGEMKESAFDNLVRRQRLRPGAILPAGGGAMMLLVPYL